MKPAQQEGPTTPTEAPMTAANDGPTTAVGRPTAIIDDLTIRSRTTMTINSPSTHAHGGSCATTRATARGAWASGWWPRAWAVVAPALIGFASTAHAQHTYLWDAHTPADGGWWECGGLCFPRTVQRSDDVLAVYTWANNGGTVSSFTYPSDFGGTAGRLYIGCTPSGYCSDPSVFQVTLREDLALSGEMGAYCIVSQQGVTISASSFELQGDYSFNSNSTRGLLSVSGNAYIGGTPGGAGLHPGEFTVGGDGDLTVGGTLLLYNTPTGANTLRLRNGGTLTVGQLIDQSGNGSQFIWTGGTLAFTGTPVLSLTHDGIFDTSLTLPPSKVLSTTGTLDGAASSSLNIAGGSLTTSGLLVRHGSAVTLSDGSYTLNGGYTQVGYEGGAGVGTFTQTGGTHTAIGFNPLLIGVSGGTGVYDLSNGTLTTTSYDPSYFTEMVGNSGPGTINQSGGTHNAARLVLGWGDSGSYNLTGGTLNVTEDSGGYYDLMVGSAGGAGHFYQNGGINNVLTRGWALVVAWGSSTAQGDYTLISGDLNASEENIGMDGVGTFTQSGGNNTITPVGFTGGQLFIGRNAGSNGTYTMHGGTLITNDIRTDNGNGTFTMDGGTVTFTDHWIRAGVNMGSTANYTMTGGTVSNATAGPIAIGEAGTGTLNLGGNVVVTSTGNGSSLLLGSGVTGTGTVHVYGSASLSVWDIRTDSGHGTFTQDGGTVTVGAGGLRLGVSAGSSSTYTLNGGTMQVTGGDTRISEYGQGTFTQTGGTHSVSGVLYVCPNSGGPGGGSYSLSGGTLTVGASEQVGANAAGSFVQTGGINSASGVVVSPWGGPGSSYSLLGGSLTTTYLTLNTGGAFTLRGAAPLTTLSATSVLYNNGTVSFGGNSATGTGLPLHAPTFTQTSAGRFDVVIGGTGDGQYGQLIVNQANLAGTLSATIAPGYVPHFGDTFTILRGGAGSSVSGVFAHTSFPILPPCLGWSVSYTPSSVVLKIVRGGCKADFNCDGAVAVQDIFDYLSTWFAGDLRAEMDALPGLQVQDIFAFLNFWFNGCPSLVWDLKADWSDVGNPTGVWTYLGNGAVLPSVVRQSQPWTVPQVSWGDLPGWFKSNGTEQFAHDWQTGDVITHTGPSTITWTSPVAGVVDITGGVWHTRNIGRSNQWTVQLNGVTLSTGVVGDGLPDSRAAPFMLSSGTGGSGAVQGITVHVGDTISLKLENLSTFGDYAGVNMTVTKR